MDLGAKFWFGVIGLAVAVGIGAWLIFALIGSAWYAWGFFGMLLALCAVLLVFAYISDRRAANRRRGSTA
jgi:Kef-type K+ transport system membrane component KefB